MTSTVSDSEATFSNPDIQVSRPGWITRSSVEVSKPSNDIFSVTEPAGTAGSWNWPFSSVTVVLAWANLRLGELKKGKIYLFLTLLCGFGFMIIKAIEYTSKFSHGLFPKTNNFYATYYVMTGLHGLHVLGGMVVFAYLILTADKWYAEKRDQFTNRVEVTGLYWHFVDLVWIFLFPILYLL